MIVAITGGTGFIGKKLVAEHLSLKNEVRVLSRNLPASDITNNHLKWFRGNLCDAEILDEFVRNVDVIYHCAGEINASENMYALHVGGTKRLLEAVEHIIKANRKPLHWVQLSSVGAYGQILGKANNYRIVTEETATNPVGDYEITKTISDEYVQKLSKIEPLFTYTILRPSTVIGPSMPNQSARALTSMIKKGLFFYIGSRSSVATYIHVNDVVAALVLCGIDIRAKMQTFNLSNDCLLSEIVNAVASKQNINIPTICIPENLLRFLVKYLSFIIPLPLTLNRIDALVKHTYYPSEKINDVLGFYPKHSIPDSFSEIFITDTHVQK